MKKSILSALAIVLALFLTQTNALAQDSEKPYNFVSMEHPPSYPGGIPKFYEFLSRDIKYPALAKENNIQGVVKVSFMVEKDGSLTNIMALTNFGYGLEEEAVRVMKRSKNWEPGLVDGKPVRVKYTIPIKFAFSKR